MKHSALFVLGLVLFQCSVSNVPDAQSSADGSSSSDAIMDVVRDDTAVTDVAVTDSNLPDVIPSDAAVDVTSSADGGMLGDPTPPVGAVLCGSGTVTHAQLLQQCNTLDPMRDLSTSSTKQCDALSFGTTEWSVYCTATQRYVWVRMTNVNSVQRQACSSSFPLEDGGALVINWSEHLWRESTVQPCLASYNDTNGMRTVFGTGPTTTWFGGGIRNSVADPMTIRIEHTIESPQSLLQWRSAQGVLALYATPRTCTGIPSGPQRIVTAVPISWTAP